MCVCVCGRAHVGEDGLIMCGWVGVYRKSALLVRLDQLLAVGLPVHDNAVSRRVCGCAHVGKWGLMAVYRTMWLGVSVTEVCARMHVCGCVWPHAILVRLNQLLAIGLPVHHNAVSMGVCEWVRVCACVRV